MEGNKVPLHPRKPTEALEALNTSFVILTIYGNAAKGAYGGTLKSFAKSPSIADQDEHPALDDVAKAYWEEKKNCLLNNVMVFGDSIGCALNFGEDPLSSVSYLKDSWEHSPAGTPVVTASDPSGTTVYIVLKNFRVELHGPMPALVPGKPGHGPHAFFVNITFALVLEEVIKGAAAALGAALFQKLKEKLGIDLGGPPTLAQISQEIQSVVIGQITAETIKEAQATTEGINHYMESEYPNLGQATDEQKKERDHELAAYDSKMYTVVSTLSREDLKKPAFSAHVLAAGMHLAILKERQLLRQEEPARATTVSSTAHAYAEYANTLLNTLYNDRMTAIVGPTVDEKVINAKTGRIVEFCSFMDNFPTADHQKHISDGGKSPARYYRADCEAALAKYKAAAEQGFKDTIKWDTCQKLIAAWRAY